MGREFHVRFREGLGVKIPRATRLIITGTSEVLLAKEVQPLVEQFLKERGLELSHEKTRITRSEDGFVFAERKMQRRADRKVQRS
jgi:RNA-directed DNA polymerase